jgi:pimeloyl-ACP methyl ester carboxylesterase
MRIEPFTIALDETTLIDLRDRLRRTRWPQPAPGAPWTQGTDEAFLRRFVEDWAERFDWRAEERRLNRLPHFRADLDGTSIHFVHQRAAGRSNVAGGAAGSRPGLPLVLTHGWPSTFLELLPLVPFLTDPAAHGLDGPAFDVVIPSLPGYGFSDRPAREGFTSRDTAALWRRLMEALGYERYGAHGTDFGVAVATFMALDAPQAVVGLHLSNLELDPWTGPGSRPLSDAERAFVASSNSWWEREGGYKAIQSTAPQTLAYGLTDSAAGLAAWVLEKWRSWSDPHSWSDAAGHDAQGIPRDLLMSLLTITWATATIGTSMRDYFDNRWFGGAAARPGEFVQVPTAVCVFIDPAETPPREWAERLYNVRRFTPMPRGGHFAAVEAPDLLARDIAAFFGPLSGPQRS